MMGVFYDAHHLRKNVLPATAVENLIDVETERRNLTRFSGMKKQSSFYRIIKKACIQI